MPIFGPPRAKSFYPRLSYGTGPTVLDFEDAAARLVVQRIPVRGQNLTDNGTLETLTIRTDTLLTIAFVPLTRDKLAELYTYVDTWGLLGKQAALTLDRLNTCGGQWEYDQFNTFFTKAELLNNPFAPTRFLMGKALYSIELVFRQGS
ncbi:MAG: hypothetical protein A2Z31_00230 [candidate division NC10 bacterium RBG_16_65_8]|nr:MAG: hypothetical protein A2Z31_00230 [candidate division NC10 bacterium RBG_16_65_8]